MHNGVQKHFLSDRLFFFYCFLLRLNIIKYILIADKDRVYRKSFIKKII